MKASEHRNISGLHADSGSGTVEDPWLGQRTKGRVTYSLAWWWGDPENRIGFNSKVLGAQAEPKAERAPRVPKPKPRKSPKPSQTEDE